MASIRARPGGVVRALSGRSPGASSTISILLYRSSHFECLPPTSSRRSRETERPAQHSDQPAISDLLCVDRRRSGAARSRRLSLRHYGSHSNTSTTNSPGRDAPGGVSRAARVDSDGTRGAAQRLLSARERVGPRQAGYDPRHRAAAGTLVRSRGPVVAQPAAALGSLSRHALTRSAANSTDQALQTRWLTAAPIISIVRHQPSADLPFATLEGRRFAPSASLPSASLRAGRMTA